MGSRSWQEPLAKLRSHLLGIRNGNASLFLNAYTYNSKFFLMASYQAQLLPLPRDCAVFERVALITHCHETSCERIAPCRFSPVALCRWP